MGVFVLFFALAAVTIGALTLFELSRGASLDRNRALNIAYWGVKLVLKAALMPIVVLIAWSSPFSLFDVSKLPWLAQFLIFLAVVDCAEYLFHRAQHSIPALWALHSLHHSDPDMNATTTERHHWADQFLKAVTIYPLVGLTVTAVPSVAFGYLLASLWNYVAHAGIPLSFGRLSWLLNSPAYHRRHHSSLPEHYNSNYAALFPIFDVIGGTYRRPDGFPPTGLDVKPDTLVDYVTWPLKNVGRRQAAS